MATRNTGMVGSLFTGQYANNIAAGIVRRTFVTTKSDRWFCAPADTRPPPTLPAASAFAAAASGGAHVPLYQNRRMRYVILWIRFTGIVYGRTGN